MREKNVLEASHYGPSKETTATAPEHLSNQIVDLRQLKTSYMRVNEMHKQNGYHQNARSTRRRKRNEKPTKIEGKTNRKSRAENKN